MPQLIKKPAIIRASGEPPKQIEEYIGRISCHQADVSIARMRSPAGWSEPGQIPDFDEYTVVLKGSVLVESRKNTIDVHAGEAVIVKKGEWVRYSTPHPGGAEYISVCLPAFSPDLVNRNES
ncbi:cupin [bacterium]|nr:cupin [bacterium]